MFNIVEKELFRWRRVRKNGREMSICTKLLVIGQIVFSSVNLAMAATTATSFTAVSGGSTMAQAANAGGGTDTTVTQTGPRATNTWATLGTVAADKLTFVQNPTDVSINKVTGNESSEFYGVLTAGGRVFILNPNGVTFGAGSQTNVGALIATTATGVTETPDGLFVFTGNGYGQVINHGNITVSPGGFAVLAAPYVANTGFIQANLGQIQLASAKDFTVDLRGDGLIDFTVSKETMDAIANDAKLGVTNTGTLQAQSGIINITAGLASDIVQSVVNLAGVVDADAFSAGHNGGTVLVTSVGDLNNTASIHADGGADGNGGTIKTWADGTNVFASGATMTARGGNDSGDGGFVEVSGKNVLYRGTANASAPHGKAGTLLLDPYDLVIADGAGTDGTATIYEQNIEATSAGGTGVSLTADHSITMNNLADDVLQGGAGDISMTVTQGGKISFLDKNDTIATTTGKITMSAADGAEGAGTIDIGHLLTTGNYADITLTAGSGGITTGNLSTGGPGVSNPGNISLTTTNSGDITTKNITITADGAEGASAYLSANAAGSLTTGNLSVTADANSTYNSTNASAEADLIAGSNITIVGDADVKAIAKSTHGDTHATARLLAAAGVMSAVSTGTGGTLTFGTGSLNITGDVHVNADASSTYNSANASAEAFLLAGNNVDITTGPTTLQVTANATTNWGDANADAILLAAAGVSELSADEGEGNSTVTAAFGTGNLKINGNIDVTANATTYDGDATAMAAAILAAGNDVNIDTYGMLKVAATAQADGSGESYGGSATAIAGLVALAGLDSLTASETATSAPTVTMTASSGNLDIVGDIHVSADATVGSYGSGYGSGYALAGAAAILAAGSDVNIDTQVYKDTLKVAASATNDGYGEADAGAALVVAAGVKSLSFSEDGAPTVTYGSGDLSIWGNILVQADAWESSESDGGHASAFANLLAPGSGSTSVYDDITVTASADHSEVNVGDLKTIGDDADIKLAAWNAEGTGNGNNGVVNASNLQTTGYHSDITVTAGSGGIMTGNLSTGGEGLHVSRPGDITLTTTNGGNITTGNINIVAEAYDYYDDTASAYLGINAAGNVHTGTIKVSADAYPNYDSSAYAHATAEITGHDITIDGNLTVDAHARGANGDTASADAQAHLMASNNVTVNGNITVQSKAEMNNGSEAKANAVLELAANPDSYETGDVTVNGNITVKSETVLDSGSAIYNTDATLAINAGNDIKITGNTLVLADAKFTGEWGGGSGHAHTDANATLSAGHNITIDGDVEVQATTLNDASYNAYDADATAVLDVYAGNDLKINGGIVVKADAKLGGSASYNTDAHADASAEAYLVAGNDVSITGPITVQANADNEAYNGSAAYAYALLAAIAERGDLNIAGNTLVTADALRGSETFSWYKDTEAGAVALLTGGRNVTTVGTTTVTANAVTGYDGGEGGPGAIAGAALVALAGVDGTELLSDDAIYNASYISRLARDIAFDEYNLPELKFNSGNLHMTGDVTVTADATSVYPDAVAGAFALFGAGNDVTILTDPITVRANAIETGEYYYGGNYSAADAAAAVLAVAGLAYDEQHEDYHGNVYITGDILAAANTSGMYRNNAVAGVLLYAPDDVTNLYATTPPTASAPNPDDPAHALVQAPTHWADDFYAEDSTGEGDFYAWVGIEAGGKVTIEPKSVAPSGCGRDECEVNNALEARRVDPIEPLPTGRDPLRIAQDGLVLWPTGAGVTAPSTGVIITADMENAIAAGGDPTVLLPATAAGGIGLSAGLDAFSIGGTDYCDQVVSGFCLPEAGGKAKK